MDVPIIERSAIGHIAGFGHVFDAVTDKFCEISTLPEVVDASMLMDITENAFSKVRLVKSDTFHEKFSKLHVSPGLQLSILTMPLNETETRSYLAENEISSRKAKCSIACSVITKEEHLNLSHEGLEFSIENITETRGTHVVVGISWGANCILSCTLEAEDDQQRNEMQCYLLSKLRKFFSYLEMKESQIVGKADNWLPLIKVKLYNDLSSRNNFCPKTIEESFEFLTHFVDHVKNCPKQALVYKLAPLSTVCKTQIPSPFRELTPTIVARVIEVFDRMYEVHSRINVYYDDLKTYWYSVSKKHSEEVEKLKLDLVDEQKNLRDEMGQIIRSIRSETQDDQHLETVINKYYASVHSPQNLINMLEVWKLIIEKLEFARKLKTYGVTYIGHDIKVENFVPGTEDQIIFVLYFNQNSKIKDSKQWEENCHIFFNRIRTKRDNFNFFAVDCDVHSEKMPDNNNTCMEIYKYGEKRVADVLSYQKKDSKIPWIQLLSEPDKVLIEPKRRGPLRIICPCKTYNAAEGMDWHCTMCFDAMEYGYDGHVYCDCGKVPAAEIEFRCPNEEHKVGFRKYQETDLLFHLNNISPFPETNILILGETGVGKSTWINSLINFLAYDSLSEAESKKPHYLVPTQFMVCDEQYNYVTVQTGLDENECFEDGESATKSTRVYSFRIGENIIRLIDTPGIGDTKGVESDKENFENVLQTLTHLNELHGICILLRPNDSRMSIGFRYCMKQLFSNLHRDASKNIVFCFTNSRQTLYKPGQTMKTLQKLLSKVDQAKIVLNQQTLYCFDSEAYRFLAAVTNKPPVKFPKDEKENFEKSWEKSISETKRLLHYIIDLPPHDISNVLSIFQARAMVLKLTRPLAEINKNILMNQNNLEKEIDEIRQTKLQKEELENRKYMARIEIETRPLDSPKLVCTNSACIRIREIGGENQIDYVTVCHSPCKLQGLDRDVVGHEQMLKCKAFYENPRACEHCEHSYRDHLYTCFESAHVEKLVEYHNVEDDLKKNMTAIEMKQHMINECLTTIGNYSKERKEVESASVKFACFLKQNAITPYNDEMEQYLNHLINEEKENVKERSKPEVLNGLEKSLESYIKQKSIIEDAMKLEEVGTKSLDPSDIQDLVDKLKNLPLSGSSFRQILDDVDMAQKKIYQQNIQQPEKYTKIRDKNLLSWASE